MADVHTSDQAAAGAGGGNGGGGDDGSSFFITLYYTSVEGTCLHNSIKCPGTSIQVSWCLYQVSYTGI